MSTSERPELPEQLRTLETRIRLDAPIEKIWHALTTGEGLKQWFGLDARDAKPGGNFWVAWGEGMAIDQPITIFEENKHLRFESPFERDGQVTSFATDFILESAEGGKTLLRIVSSGFGGSASWDDEFDGMLKGWAIFATNIAHYLRRHAGRVARSFGFPLGLGLSREEAWARLTGTRGFGLPETAALGADVAIRTGWGDSMRARLDVFSPPATCGVVLADYNDALLRFELNGKQPDQCYFNLMALVWDMPADRVAALEQRVRGGIEQLFADKLGTPPTGCS